MLTSHLQQIRSGLLGPVQESQTVRGAPLVISLNLDETDEMEENEQDSDDF